jgi:shikimate dehydrogenase
MNIIHGTTRTCGLIGNPVGHSISPVIHNTLADICGTDLVYTTFKVEKDDVASAVKGAYALNILGLNVTVPHKQAVMETLVDIDPLAKAIGAVNTLQRVDGGYKGYNTDILGLERELEDENVDLKGSNAVILGAGGAARAIAFLCASKSPKSVTILNRTLEKAQNIADAVNSYFKSDIAKADTIDRADKLPVKDYVVIQATSVGLYPNVDDVPVSSPEFYENARVGVDIIYNPYTTKFMKLMQEHGKPACNGLKMLLYQGVAAFEIWNGCKVSKEMAEKVYVAMREALGINE